MRLPSRRGLLLPLVVALAVRLACLPLAEHSPRIGDVAAYVGLARLFHEPDVARHLHLQSGIRPPLYPLLISLCLDMESEPPDPFPWVYVVQVLGDVLACALLMALTHRRFGVRAAAAAGWIYALFPPACLYSATTAWVESLSVLLTAAALLALDRVDGAMEAAPGRPLRRWTILLGLVLGLGVLTRESMTGLAGVFLLALLFRRRVSWRRCLGVSAGVLAAIALVTLPWAIRNLRLHGVLVYSGTFGHYSMMIDNAPPGETTYQWWLQLEDTPSRLEMARTVFARALTEYPGLTATRAGTRLRVLLGPEITVPTFVAMPLDGFVPDIHGDFQTVWRSAWRLPAGSWGWLVQMACGLATVVLFSLGAAGLLGTRSGILARVAVWMTLATLAAVLLTVASARYRFSLVPFLLPFAAWALSAPPWRLPRRAAIGGLVCAALLGLSVFVVPAP